MDRFIGSARFRKYHQWTALKSNMDRFIVKQLFPSSKLEIPLKSNMDRFIVSEEKLLAGLDHL